MKTTERLAQALREAGAPTAMINNALAGHYDDYKSESDTPIQDLVRDALVVNLPQIADRATMGEFDSTEEEAKAWFDREGKDLLKRDNPP